MNEEKVEYMEENVYGNTYTAMEALLINCRAIQKESRNGSFENGRPQYYLREMCTVRCSSSRRCGNSTAAIKLALDYFRRVAFISPSYSIRDHFWFTFKTYCEKNSIVFKNQKKYVAVMDNESEYHFFSAGQLNSLRGMHFESIIIDPYSEIDNNVIQDIYDIGGPCMANNFYKFFILVG